jgi:hypothetical protein
LFSPSLPVFITLHCISNNALMLLFNKKNMEKDLLRERSRQQIDLKGQDVQIQELKATIARNESIIQMLQVQLHQNQTRDLTDHSERQFFIDDLSVSCLPFIFSSFFCGGNMTWLVFSCSF